MMEAKCNDRALLAEKPVKMKQATIQMVRAKNVLVKESTSSCQYQYKDPCMDSFGSNATPMGGAAGRTDAMIGAMEEQKAEGVC